MPEPTARERLLNYALAATPNAVTWERAEQLADAYETERRDQVLTEAAELIRASGDAWTDDVRAADAASLLLAARTAPDAP